jgi:hypothetical protein
MRQGFGYRFKAGDRKDLQSVVEKYRYHFDLNGYSAEKEEGEIDFRYIPETALKPGELMQNLFEPLRSGTVKLKEKDERIQVRWSVNVLSIIVRSFVIGFFAALLYNYYLSDLLLNTIIAFASVFSVSYLISFIHLRVRIAYFNGCVFE